MSHSAKPSFWSLAYQLNFFIPYVLIPGICLFLSCVLSFCVRLYSALRHEAVVHEYDPHFNLVATRYLEKEGIHAFWTWFDERSWYPLGRYVGGSVYPGLMLTARAAHYVLNEYLSRPVDISIVCVYLPAVLSSVCPLLIYGFTATVWNTSAALLAALFAAVAPGLTQRSVAGAYDNECAALPWLLCAMWLFARAMRTGSVMTAFFAALATFFLAATWGGYGYLLLLIPSTLMVLLLSGRLSARTCLVYAVWLTTVTVTCLNVPTIGFAAVVGVAHVYAWAVLLLSGTTILLESLLQHAVNSDESAQSLLPKVRRVLFALVAVGSIGVSLATMSSKVALGGGSFDGRLRMILGFASSKAVMSVGEHISSTWASMYLAAPVIVLTAPAAALLLSRQPSEVGGLLLLWGASSAYGAATMVRLCVLFAPPICVLAGIAFSTALSSLAAALVASYRGYLVTVASPTQVLFGVNVLRHLPAALSGSSSSSTDKNLADGLVQVLHPGNQSAAAIATSNSSSPTNSSPRADSRRSSSTNLMAVLFVVLAFFCMAFFHQSNWCTFTMFSDNGVTHPISHRLKGLYPKGFGVFTGTEDQTAEDEAQFSSSMGDVEPWLRQSLSAPSPIHDDLREAYAWIRYNTPSNSIIVSWWDYGYQIAALANRTTVIDGNTWNVSRMALVGRMFASPEEDALATLRSMDADYVLMLYGGVAGMTGDDVAKFWWMAHIGRETFPDTPFNRLMSSPQKFTMSEFASDDMRKSVMYKLANFDLAGRSRVPVDARLLRSETDLADSTFNFGHDHARDTALLNENVTLCAFEHVFSSHAMIVRIYKLKPDGNRWPLLDGLRGRCV